VTRVRLEDLPPRVREKVLKGADAPRKRTTRLVADTRGARWSCHACKTLSLSWAAVERHRDQNRHYRFEQEVT
jgi:hypothetical protein